MKNSLLILCLFAAFAPLSAQNFPLSVKGERLQYEQDARGNRLLDFSYCGYRNSDVDIPNVPVVVCLSAEEGDQSPRIQQAIDYVASLKPDAEGRRGTVLLEKGTYRLNSGLHITASGIVLRGADKTGTILLKQGCDRGAVIYIEGKNDLRVKDTLQVLSDYVPVNATAFKIESASSASSASKKSSARQLMSGDRVWVHRPSTEAWIRSLGCEVFGGGIAALGWKKGDIDLDWDRTVREVRGDTVVLNAPLSMALDRSEAESVVLTYEWPGRIAECGVENLTLVSDYDPQFPHDENHAWTGISIDNAENCWVRLLCFRQFAGSAVIVQRGASCVTVEDCIATQPVSELAGMRRRVFHTQGQHTLFQRCYSEQGINDFSAGMTAAGPNAFVQCEAKEAEGFSGSTGAWACGLLFDVVDIDGNDLMLGNLGQAKNGAGWNTANSLCWQCTAAEIHCYSPTATERNYAYGCWAQFSGNGVWGQSNNHVKPRSLFAAQLEERLGRDVSQRTRVLPRKTDASSSPTVEQAMLLAQEAYEPKLTLKQWIEQHSLSFKYEVLSINPRLRNQLKNSKAQKLKSPIAIKNGYLTANGTLLAGERRNVRWWNGNLKPGTIRKATPHITRFVPDQEGTGLTDRIDTVVAEMKRSHAVILDHNYGLWYDRRRDDHERIRRRDADVWAPFYEQPFARTGQGRAWDGMSLYDLTRPNTWYWSRLREFADKAEAEGLLLFHENYFQHNIIEAGAHWVDCPWRTANNVNSTGFPEPVNFAGDKRVFVADMFYDVTHPVRRELHRRYIRQCLDNFAHNGNVGQLVSEEYTGPLHFVQFWLDCIAEWERETGRHPLIALATTKDVQDSILADPDRAPLIDIIDIRYWHYREDGSLYAPEGGKNLAPRQHARKVKPGKMGDAGAYKAVSEYRAKYPDKAVTLAASGYADCGWAVLMAGGSCPVLTVTDEAFLSAVPQMKPAPSDDANVRLLCGDNGAVAYATQPATLRIPLPAGSYALRYIRPSDGKVTLQAKKLKVTSSEGYTLQAPEAGAYWFSKQ